MTYKAIWWGLAMMIVSHLSLFSAPAQAGRDRQQNHTNNISYCQQIDGYCYEIEFTDIDDDVHLLVNGREVFSQDRTKQGKDSGRIRMDDYLQPGANTIDIRLGNGGCWRTSLNVTIYANDQITLPTRSYWQEASHCGWQLNWRYRFDREAGIEVLQ